MWTSVDFISIYPKLQSAVADHAIVTAWRLDPGSASGSYVSVLF